MAPPLHVDKWCGLHVGALIEIRVDPALPGLAVAAGIPCAQGQEHVLLGDIAVVLLFPEALALRAGQELGAAFRATCRSDAFADYITRRAGRIEDDGGAAVDFIARLVVARSHRPYLHDLRNGIEHDATVRSGPAQCSDRFDRRRRDIVAVEQTVALRDQAE